MGEFILEVMGSIITESLPHLFQFIGACFRWCFFLGRKNFQTILKEEWNKRIGLLTVVLIIGLIIWFNK